MQKKELTNELHKLYHNKAKNIFAESNFKRFKTNDYMRITEDDILQWINIQKHSWDIKFTFNIGVFPLFYKSDFIYYAFGGIRIWKFILDRWDYWWNYLTEYDRENSLNESLNIFKSEVLPFLDSIGNSKKLYNHLNSENNLFGENHGERWDKNLELLLLKRENIDNFKWNNQINSHDSLKLEFLSTINENYNKFKIDKKKYCYYK